MDFLKVFISEYGTMILYSILVAIGGALGVAFKNIYKRYVDTKTKKEVVSTCVKAVEQLYYNLDGETKLERCIEAATEMLGEKGITISALELRYDLEAAVAEFKKNSKVEEESLDPGEGDAPVETPIE